MLPAEQKRFDRLYAHHVQALKLQGKSQKTIDAYARAVRRVAQHFDRCPDRLTTAQLQRYFCELVDSHSWSTVKVDRNGLQCFWKHVLKREWTWLERVKAPRVRSLPDILTRAEVEQLSVPGNCARWPGATRDASTACSAAASPARFEMSDSMPGGWAAISA